MDSARVPPPEIEIQNRDIVVIGASMGGIEAVGSFDREDAPGAELADRKSE